ncbi:MAG: hypothetical protein AABX88_01150 [Nanoarchaeota archaeon]
MVKTLQQIIAGILVGVCALAYPLKSEADWKKVYDKVYPLQLKEGNRVIDNEEIEINAQVNDDTNEFEFFVGTKNWDKNVWTNDEKLIPSSARNTSIYIPEMGMVLFHPKDVKILKVKQIARLVYGEEYKDELLIPYENHKPAQMALGLGEKIINNTLSKFVLGERGWKKLMDAMKNNDEEYYKNIFPENKEYISTKIPFYLPKKLFGFTETAREIIITFDVKDNCPKEMSFWINPAFGNPSMNTYSQGTFPTGYGQLDGVMVNFYIGKKGNKNCK